MSYLTARAALRARSAQVTSRKCKVESEYRNAFTLGPWTFNFMDCVLRTRHGLALK